MNNKRQQNNQRNKGGFCSEENILTLSGSNCSFIGYAPGCKFKENNIKSNAEETQPPNQSN